MSLHSDVFAALHSPGEGGGIARDADAPRKRAAAAHSAAPAREPRILTTTHSANAVPATPAPIIATFRRGATASQRTEERAQKALPAARATRSVLQDAARSRRASRSRLRARRRIAHESRERRAANQGGALTIGGRRPPTRAPRPPRMLRRVS